MKFFLLISCLCLSSICRGTQTLLDWSCCIEIHKTFVEQLRDGESVIITVSESGCFTTKARCTVLEIRKDGTSFIAYHRGMSKKLSLSDVDFVRNFELKLDSVSTFSKCTVNQNYLIRYNKKTKIRIDSTCSWHGFEKLIANLFKVEDAGF